MSTVKVPVKLPPCFTVNPLFNVAFPFASTVLPKTVAPVVFNVDVSTPPLAVTLPVAVIEDFAVIAPPKLLVVPTESESVKVSFLKV